MPYYGQGDYYRGDYYRAGGIFSFVGKAVKGLGKLALGALGVQSPPKIQLQLPAAQPIPSQGGLINIGSGTQHGLINIQRPPGITTLPAPGMPMISGGGFGRSYRRMNPLNVKAARRSIRRLTSLEKTMRRIGRFTNPGKVFRLKVRKRRTCK